MHLKGLAITMGLGAAAGAVAILMMPRTNPTRQLAAKAADIIMILINDEKQAANKLTNTMDM